MFSEEVVKVFRTTTFIKKKKRVRTEVKLHRIKNEMSRVETQALKLDCSNPSITIH